MYCSIDGRDDDESGGILQATLYFDIWIVNNFVNNFEKKTCIVLDKHIYLPYQSFRQTHFLMKTTTPTTELHITAQVYVKQGKSWKPKGGAQFILEVDTELYYIDEEASEKLIQKLLKAQSTKDKKFTYVSSELFFDAPIELDAKQYNDLLKKELGV